MGRQGAIEELFRISMSTTTDSWLRPGRFNVTCDHGRRSREAKIKQVIAGTQNALYAILEEDEVRRGRKLFEWQ